MALILRQSCLFFQSLSFSRRNISARFNPPRLELIVRRELRKHGITIGGDKCCDIQVHDSRFFPKFALDPATGIVESYVDGWWSPNSLPGFFDKLISEWGSLQECHIGNSKWATALRYFRGASYQFCACVKKPPVFSGIELCVAFLNWLANHELHKSTHHSGESQQHNEEDQLIADDEKLNPELNGRRGSLIIKDLHQMGIQDSISIQAMIEDFENPNSQLEYDAKFYRMWQFYLHGVRAAFLRNEQ